MAPRQPLPPALWWVSPQDMVQGWMPVNRLTAVADLKFVTRFTPPDYAVTKTGGVNSEGDLIHRAHVVRGLSRFTGAGVTVGVISDGVDSRTSAQATGDPSVQLEIDPDLPGEATKAPRSLKSSTTWRPTPAWHSPAPASAGR